MFLTLSVFTPQMKLVHPTAESDRNLPDDLRRKAPCGNGNGPFLGGIKTKNGLTN